MEIVKPKFKYSVCGSVTSYPVIIVAAGSSSRMNGVNKQLLAIGGVPVIVRTLQKFDNSPFISRIILVVKKDDCEVIQRLCDEYNINKLTDITEGGKDRHASVMNGISRLSETEEKVLIHDGARPFVNDFVIGNVAEELGSCDAVICGVKINDTVKRVDSQNLVSETVDRNGLFSVQTPQGIDVKAYIEACEKLENADLFTDDAGIFEAAGKSVKMVTGSRRNIKITTAEDIPLAELYLKEETL